MCVSLMASLWAWRTDRRHYWDCFIKWPWNWKLLPVWQRRAGLLSQVLGRFVTYFSTSLSSCRSLIKVCQKIFIIHNASIVPSYNKRFVQIKDAIDSFYIMKTVMFSGIKLNFFLKTVSLVIGLESVLPTKQFVATSIAWSSSDFHVSSSLSLFCFS